MREGEGDKVVAAFMVSDAGDDAESAAVAWLARLTSGDADAADWRDFRFWREQNPAHDQAFRKIGALWGALDQVLPAAGPLPLSSPPRPLPARRWQAAAAAVFCLVLAAAFPDFWSAAFADYRTAVGEQRTVSLADGSRIHLNTDTAISVAFADNRRRIVLHRGEAEFDVAHDAGRPFLVESGVARTEALGTRFLVRRQGGDGLVTLLEGTVQVSEDTAAKSSVILKPGQQVGFHGEALDALEVADTESATAWRRGRLVMNFVPLRQVIAEIDRYHRGRVILLNEAMADHEVNVAIDIDRIDAWLASLDGTLPLRVIRITPLLTLLK